MQIHYNKNLKQFARKLRKTSSRSERKLWCYLKSKQIGGYDFHRQKPIGNFIADFFCNRLKLVIELDGYSHSFEHSYQKDQIRDKFLNDLGIVVLRFNDEDVIRNIDDVLSAIWKYVFEFESRLGGKF